MTLEDEIADYSDCIIIICESESAFAELGAFTLSEKLVKQVLIINDEQFRNEASFITLGPIARANVRSKFKPVLYADFRAISRSVGEIKTKLETIERAYRRSVPLASEKDFRKALPKHQALFLADLIHLLSPTTLREVAGVLQFIYGESYFDVSLELALLRSLGLVKRLDAGWLRYSPQETTFFYDYHQASSAKLRGLVVRYYNQKDRDRLLFFCPRL